MASTVPALASSPSGIPTRHHHRSGPRRWAKDRSAADSIGPPQLGNPRLHQRSSAGWACGYIDCAVLDARSTSGAEQPGNVGLPSRELPPVFRVLMGFLNHKGPRDPAVYLATAHRTHLVNPVLSRGLLPYCHCRLTAARITATADSHRSLRRSPESSRGCNPIKTRGDRQCRIGSRDEDRDQGCRCLLWSETGDSFDAVRLEHSRDGRHGPCIASVPAAASQPSCGCTNRMNDTIDNWRG